MTCLVLAGEAHGNTVSSAAGLQEEAVPTRCVPDCQVVAHCIRTASARSKIPIWEEAGGRQVGCGVARGRVCRRAPQLQGAAE